MSTVLRTIRSRIAAAKSHTTELCHPTLTAGPPSGGGWIHEVKHDGFRLMVIRDGAGLRLITRNGYDWTRRYPSIESAANALKGRSFRIDGEAVVCDDSGLAVFNGLRHGPQRNPAAILYAFDLIELDGRDLRREPIERRKAALTRLLGRKPNTGIRFTEHLAIDGAIMFEHACRLGCEGIVSKRLGSLYRAGRSKDWLKTKNPAAPWKRRLEEEEWN